MLQSLRIFALVMLACVGGSAQLFGDPVNLGRVQFYSFPVLLFLIGTSGPVHSLSPLFRRGFIGVLGLLFVGFLAHRFILNSRSPGASVNDTTFEVAILANDTFGGFSRAIREEILRRSPIPLVVETGSTRILDAASARDYLNVHRDVKTLIWGTRERLVLEQQLAPGLLIRDVAHTVAPLNELTLVREVPRLVLPVDDGFHSFLYLARLLSGFASPKTDEFDALSRVRSAAFLEGQWPGQSHLAYAFWESGTRFLQLGLSSEIRGLAYIECALASFRVAWRRLTMRDNPYLAAAILNNHGVALAAKGVLEVAPAQLRLATNALRRGKSIVKTMKFQGAQMNAKGDRLFFGKALTRNLRILGDYGIWNDLPSARRMKKKKKLRKSSKCSKRKDQKKGDTVHG
jgi:hypothetical protein